MLDYKVLAINFDKTKFISTFYVNFMLIHNLSMWWFYFKNSKKFSLVCFWMHQCTDVLLRIARTSKLLKCLYVYKNNIISRTYPIKCLGIYFEFRKNTLQAWSRNEESRFVQFNDFKINSRMRPPFSIYFILL